VEAPPLRFARPLGASYLAEEILFDRVRALLPDDFDGGTPGHAGHGAHGAMPESHGAAASRESATEAMHHGVPRLVLIAGGAETVEDAHAIEGALAAMARRASEKFGLASATIQVLYDWSAPDSLVEGGFRAAIDATQAAAVHGEAIVVPFNFATRL